MFPGKCILIFGIYIGGYIGGLLHFLQHLIICFRYSEIFNHPFVIAIWNGGSLLVFYKIFRSEREVPGKTQLVVQHGYIQGGRIFQRFRCTLHPVVACYQSTNGTCSGVCQSSVRIKDWFGRMPFHIDGFPNQAFILLCITQWLRIFIMSIVYIIGNFQPVEHLCTNFGTHIHSAVGV